MMVKDIDKMKNGDQEVVQALILNIQDKVSKKGSVYTTLTISDSEKNQKDLNFFNATKDQLDEKYHLKVANVTVWKDDGGYLKIVKLRLAEDIDIAEFVPSAPIPAEQMYNEIVSLLDVYREKGGIALIALRLYEANKEKLLRWSAAKKLHHANLGGLLYHVYRMMQIGSTMCEIYNLNRELLLTGIALHDIGKLIELDTNEVGVADYTTTGQLFGHPYLGAMMVHDVVAAAPCDDFFPVGFVEDNEEMIKLLTHMIVSHHGKAEFGAISMPAIPEAYIMSEIDMMDSRYYMYESTIENMDAGAMSDRVFGLDGTRVYKPEEK